MGMILKTATLIVGIDRVSSLTLLTSTLPTLLFTKAVLVRPNGAGTFKVPFVHLC